MNVGGSHAPTLREVADRAGVSVSTASRALSGRPHVSDARRESVEAAARALGYRPNATARSLRTQRSLTVGFVAHSLLSPGLLRVLNGMTLALEEAEYTLLVTQAHGSQASYRRLLPRLFDRRIDGLFLANPDLAPDDLSLYREAMIPALALVSRGPDCGDLPLVNVIPEAACQELARRLAELGHRRAAFMVTEISQRTEFAQTLQAALLRNDIEPLLFEVERDRVDSAVGCVIAASDAPGGPTVAFATFDHTLALFAACSQAGREIARDLSLCAITDHESLTLPAPPIAALHTDNEQLGRRAAEIMFRWMEGHPPANVTSLDSTRWLHRASIGPARPAS